MNPYDPITQTSIQLVDLFCMARLRVNVAGVATYLQQSHVDTITYNVYVSGVPTSPTPLTLDPAVVIFNTLQAPPTNTIWTVDKKGYNLGFSLSRLLIPDPDLAYIVPVRLELAFGNELVVKFKIKTKAETQ